MALSGVEGVNIAETLADAEQPEAVDAVLVDEPTVAIDFLVNTSPFAGREGKYVTSRHLKERLETRAGEQRRLARGADAVAGHV